MPLTDFENHSSSAFEFREENIGAEPGGGAGAAGAGRAVEQGAAGAGRAVEQGAAGAGRAVEQGAAGAEPGGRQGYKNPL